MALKLTNDTTENEPIDETPDYTAGIGPDEQQKKGYLTDQQRKALAGTGSGSSTPLTAAQRLMAQVNATNMNYSG